MLQTILVYLFLLLTMMAFVSKTFKIEGVALSNNIFGIKNSPLILAMLLFAVVFGMRYGVGVDHLGYLDDYKDILNSQHSGKIMEPAFAFITNLFAAASLHYSFYFSFLAFLQIFFLFYTFKRNEERVLPFLVLTLILGGVYLSYMNGIRQQLAFCIFVFSLEFIFKRKPIKHYLLILLAFMFHSSALLLLPIYFLFQLKKKFMIVIGII